MEEKIIWEGTPSQWTNLNFYLVCMVFTAAFGLGLLMALWMYFETKCHKIQITDQRIILRTGIFSKTINETELYRVKDITLLQPFILRLVNLSTIHLDSTDHSNPQLSIKGVPNGQYLKEKLREAVDLRRDIKGVKEVDFN